MPLVVEYTFFPLHLKPVQTQKKCSAASSTLVVTNLLSNYRQRLYTKYHISWLPCVPDSNWCRPLVGMPGRSHPPLPLPATCIMNIPCTLNFRHTVHGLTVCGVCVLLEIYQPPWPQPVRSAGSGAGASWSVRRSVGTPAMRQINMSDNLLGNLASVRLEQGVQFLWSVVRRQSDVGDIVVVEPDRSFMIGCSLFVLCPPVNGIYANSQTVLINADLLSIMLCCDCDVLSRS